ncbi:MAG: hypothetical protein IJ213_03340 [Bacteroidales bacterium]|nr:hypothetical protein [Bacteroidales bacterium]
MKKIIQTLTFAIVMIVNINVFAQTEEPESARPSTGVTVYRECDIAYIERDTVYDVLIELTAADYRDSWNGVKIVVSNIKTGKKLYQYHFPKSYLYGYSDKSIQVGKGNILTQVTIFRSSWTGEWIARIKEKGIY